MILPQLKYAAPAGVWTRNNNINVLKRFKKGPIKLQDQLRWTNQSLEKYFLTTPDVLGPGEAERPPQNDTGVVTLCSYACSSHDGPPPIFRILRDLRVCASLRAFQKEAHHTLLHCVTKSNKNYYVVRNAGSARSRNT